MFPTKNQLQSKREDQMTGQVFEGESGQAPILGAKFWKKGEKLIGKVGGTFDTRNGVCTIILLDADLAIDGSILNPPIRGTQKLRAVAVGNMKGFESAIALSGAGELQKGDGVEILCTGEQDTGQASPMITFKVKVFRPDP
jgi:hypothetical protein